VDVHVDALEDDHQVNAATLERRRHIRFNGGQNFSGCLVFDADERHVE